MAPHCRDLPYKAVDVDLLTDPQMTAQLTSDDPVLVRQGGEPQACDRYCQVFHFILSKNHFLSPRPIARIFLKVSMDCQVDLDPTHSAIRVTVTAAVLTHELVDDCYRSVALAASHGGPYSAIWDLSGVTSTTVSADDIRNLALTSPGIPAGVRPRVVVANKPVVYGLSRMLELYRESMGGLLKVVRSMEEAYAMLGVRPEDFTERLFP